VFITRTFIEPAFLTIGRTLPFFILVKQFDEPAGQFIGHLYQVHSDTGTYRTFYLQLVTIKLAKAAYRLDDNIIDRHPHRAAPVGVAPKEIGGRVAGIILHFIIHPIDRDFIGVLFMVF
jgi:hypothetical protein